MKPNLKNSQIVAIFTMALIIVAGILLPTIKTMTVRGSIVMIGLSAILFFSSKLWGKGTHYSLEISKKYRYLGHSNHVLFLKEEVVELIPYSNNTFSEVFNAETQLLPPAEIKEELPRLFHGIVFGDKHNLKPGDMCIAVKGFGSVGVKKVQSKEIEPEETKVVSSNS